MSSVSRSRFAVGLALGALLPLGFYGCAADHLPDGLYARIYTTRGPVLARLEPDLTPLAVANFVGLAEGTIENAAFDPGRPFYDGTVIHRVEAGHVIQMGIPSSDRANGPGYVFPNEMHASLSHDHAGALNFANGGPNTNAAQWCITLGDRSYLDGDYIVFGNVVEGMDVVFSIVRDDVIDSVRIVRVGERASAFHPDTESFRVMVQAAEARVAEQAVLKREAEEAWIRENYPELATPRDSVRSAVLSPGSLPREGEGPVQARYRGTRIRYVGHLLGHEGPAVETTAFGSREDGLPGFVDPPRPFPVDPGDTSINPALDRVLAEMTPGERRIVVVPSEFGYGRAGVYPPETPGEPRFVIGPNTLLVYEVELLGR
jgi:peptidylprolyl isomerase